MSSNLLQVIVWKVKNTSSALIITIESDSKEGENIFGSHQLDSFNGNLKVLRLFMDKDDEEIKKFQNMYGNIKCPSLSLYGPGSAKITKTWELEFPSVEELITHLILPQDPVSEIEVILRYDDKTAHGVFSTLTSIKEVKEWVFDQCKYANDLYVSGSEEKLELPPETTLGNTSFYPKVELIAKRINIEEEDMNPRNGFKYRFIDAVNKCLSIIDPFPDKQEIEDLWISKL